MVTPAVVSLFWIVFLSSLVENYLQILVWAALNLDIAFRKISIFLVLILPVCTYETYLHLMVSSLLFLFKDLKILSFFIHLPA